MTSGGRTRVDRCATRRYVSWDVSLGLRTPVVALEVTGSNPVIHPNQVKPSSSAGRAAAGR
jgi:hypothetical protein